jgi:nucleoside-diphosphate-sugar epimerase
LILVTGATGFLGREVVRQLQNTEYAFKCLIHTPGKERVLKISDSQIVYGDLLNRNSLDAMLMGIDIIINIAGTSPFGEHSNVYRRVNVGSTLNLIERSESANVKRFIHISAVSSSNDSSSPFLRSKFLSEKVVTKSSLEFTILRFAHVYGPEDRFLNYSAALLKLLPIKILYGDSEALLQPIHIQDVGKLILQSMYDNSFTGKEIDLVGPESISYMELYKLINDKLSSGVVKYAPYLQIPEWFARLISNFWGLSSPLNISFSNYMTDGLISKQNVGNIAIDVPLKKLSQNLDYVKDINLLDSLKILFGNNSYDFEDYE